ncbi:unnamed protein product [Leptidea sinapis]|uniref:Fatty acid desaturase domain-containing protein n=1 Tax=Leptidea sinapis TaxID=189913 RepID=A0A5E4R837_9NEOP|nr:unnamed protein product [Leptidea sinapis]
MTEVPKKSEPSLGETFRAFEKNLGFKNDIKWPVAISIILYHLFGIYWCYHYALPVKWQTVGFAMFMFLLSGFGITGGAHRLWTHKSYKATLPLKLFLLGAFASAGQNIVPSENRFVATVTLGEGWHNYHHMFPFDYKAAEHFDPFNWCTYFINFFRSIGWAYDFREATPEMINATAKRLGDGTPVHNPVDITNSDY